MLHKTIKLASKHFLLVVFILFSVITPSCIIPSAIPASKLCQDTARHRLLIQPDDTYRTNKETIKCFISNARQSIYLTIYELADMDIINAMVAAKTANQALDIRVIFNCSSFKVCNQPGQNDSLDPNASAKLAFSDSGIKWKNADPTFTVTHQKTFTFDAATSIIMTFNLNPDYFVSTRDFAVITRDEDEVKEIVAVFLNDWATPIKPSHPFILAWSPSNSREKIKSIISSANKSIDIYIEEFNDNDIASALITASKRLKSSGGEVRVITAVLSTPSDPTKDGNLAIRQYLNKNNVLARYGDWQLTPCNKSSSNMYVHVKTILTDYGTPNSQAYVGSENFSATSLDKNRELGIILKWNLDAGLLDLLHNTFSEDWPKCRTDS